ncbi:hypothetical protein AZ78_1431 [Lysobacter capsici AZ78]|uniref:Uncharacterized protein n=1 Tax=Lysobacter capsici AZ78 TaxID=1444315 RepID=A0A108U7A7_9GAMM|nr:hypothetical protein AZ78_1431 [Lysobacter capsici AZ78]
MGSGSDQADLRSIGLHRGPSLYPLDYILCRRGDLLSTDRRHIGGVGGRSRVLTQAGESRWSVFA